MRGTPSVTARLLGPPQFLVAGEPVSFETRKMQALCVYVAAHGKRCIPRDKLSGMLWGQVCEAKARTSLRTALSALGRQPATSALIERNRTSVWFAGNADGTDLSAFHEAIAMGTAAGFRRANVLWSGTPLDGAEIGEPVFDDWVDEFRQSTTSFVNRYLHEQLSKMGGAPQRASAADTLVALCELILRIEPSDTTAAERLITHLIGRGETAAATRCYRGVEAALAELELPVPRAFKELGSRIAPACQSPMRTNALSERFYGNGVPRVALVPPSGSRPTPDLFSFAHSEVMTQLTRFRSMRCFEPLPPLDDEGVPRFDMHHIRLSDGIEHDYKLLLWNHPNRRSVYLRCVHARRLNTVTCIEMSYAELEDKHSAAVRIAGAINMLEQDILNDDGINPESPFGRWLAAYKELQQFTCDGDLTALDMLEDLAADAEGSKLSLVHSSISAIMMKQRMYSPTQVCGVDGLARAEQCVARALALDPHEPFNHVMAGWLHIHEREHSRAMPAFERALALNPHSSRVLISAAEACAFSGDIERGRALADKAMTLAGRFVPPYYYGYLASIAYLAGDLSECLRQLDRSPVNVGHMLLEIAASEEWGDSAKAAKTRGRLERHLSVSKCTAAVDKPGLSRWITSANVARDPSQRRRMFGALERAGLPVTAS